MEGLQQWKLFAKSGRVFKMKRIRDGLIDVAFRFASQICPQG